MILTADIFGDILAQIAPFAARDDDYRPIFNCVHLSYQGGTLTAQASDSVILARRSWWIDDQGSDGGAAFDVCVTADSLLKAKRLLSSRSAWTSTDIVISQAIEGTFIHRTRVKKSVVFVDSIELNRNFTPYPDTARIIDDANKPDGTIQCDGLQLAEALAALTPAAAPEDMIQLSTHQIPFGTIGVLVPGKTDGVTCVSIPCTSSGTIRTINLDVNRLRAAVKLFRDCHISMRSADQAVMVRGEISQLQYILMPMATRRYGRGNS